MKVWIILLFSAKLEKLHAEIEYGGLTEFEAKLEAQIKMSKREGYDLVDAASFKPVYTFKNDLPDSYKATLPIIISAKDVNENNLNQENVSTYSPVERENNIKKFIYNLNLINDKYTVNEEERAVINIIKGRIEKESLPVDKS